MREHTFVTSQGSAQGRFQRACDRGNVLQAEMAARELGHVNLMNALALVVVYACATARSSSRLAARAPNGRAEKTLLRLV